jgi:hypothetical protein
VPCPWRPYLVSVQHLAVVTFMRRAPTTPLSVREGGVLSPRAIAQESAEFHADDRGVSVATHGVMGVSHLLRGLAASGIALVLGAGPASAVTPDELAALSKEGLGDEVLIALIDASGLSAVVDAPRALQLKRQGVSDRVIAAAVRASAPPTIVPEPAAEPCWACESAAPAYQAPTQPVVVEREVVHREVYYVPWIVAPSRPGPARKPQPYLAGDRGTGRFVNDGVSLPRDTKPTSRR